MTIAGIITALGGLSAVIGGVVWIFKYSAWAVTKTPEQKEESIVESEQKKMKDSEQSGRPE